ncbi:hypothetical protein AVEN_178835-1 [Araneus ventricosus]|uniref:Uncharacterized protein n=1 Tax=Araneus ventricosus TaxID=182803 RepID=A0A4Y2BDV7_ARAVE|nr:hypothetical protein AVEN_178835-1 [Araneus ventricosus]
MNYTFINASAQIYLSDTDMPKVTSYLSLGYKAPPFSFHPATISSRSKRSAQDDRKAKKKHVHENPFSHTLQILFAPPTEHSNDTPFSTICPSISHPYEAIIYWFSDIIARKPP